MPGHRFPTCFEGTHIRNSRTRQACQIPGSNGSLSPKAVACLPPVPQEQRCCQLRVRYLGTGPPCRTGAGVSSRRLCRPLRCDGDDHEWAGQAQAGSPLGSKCPLYSCKLPHFPLDPRQVQESAHRPTAHLPPRWTGSPAQVTPQAPACDCAKSGASSPQL